MRGIDAFASELFEEAKRFLEKAKDAEPGEAQNSCLHAALLLGICSLEAHLNSVCEEMSARSNLSTVEKSVLLEKEFVFDKGEFRVANRLRIYSLTDRILFVAKRFALKGRQLDQTADWWSKLHQGIDARNSLVHPKEEHEVTYEQVKSTFEGILGTVDALYMVIYNQHFPALGRHLDSNMGF